ncbi:MAG: hypothetical protein ACREDO_03455 [Methyloceanibacter sp.]
MEILGRKILISTAAAVILAGGAVALAPVSAKADSGCGDRAEVMYPYNKKARKAYKEACKDNYKSWKKARKKGVWIRY